MKHFDILRKWCKKIEIWIFDKWLISLDRVTYGFFLSHNDIVMDLHIADSKNTSGREEFILWCNSTRIISTLGNLKWSCLLQMEDLIKQYRIWFVLSASSCNLNLFFFLYTYYTTLFIFDARQTQTKSMGCTILQTEMISCFYKGLATLKQKHKLIISSQIWKTQGYIHSVTKSAAVEFTILYNSSNYTCVL